jgi:NAD(P)-dependent dehydrogenase (short-subunit alcohol dehydrogenase family)
MTGKSPVMIVTGASGSIGAGIALAAGGAGYSVVVNFKSNAAAAARIVAAIRASGGRAIAVQADVAHQTDVRHLFAVTMDELGTPTVLVNNAGIIGAVQPVEAADEVFLNNLFAANVTSAFLCAGEAARVMSRRHGGAGGSIVNITSAAARHGGMIGEAHYAASKGAIDVFTVALAKELGGEGIRVNAVRPGLIESPIHEIHGGPQAIAKLADTVPLRRTGSAQEVADVLLWLVSERASYVHGAVIDVTGGR